MMILRRSGGRHSRIEKWAFQGEEIEIVKEYKYLGVLISSNSNMKKHLQVKLAEAKRAICSVWGSCIHKKSISHTSKQKIFRSTATSILLYGAQAWGFRPYETVEKFLRYFIRRFFRIPTSSPNYMLHLESGVSPMYLDTLKIHFNYIMRVLAMNEQRIPKIVLKHLMSTEGGCVKEWKKLASECGVNLVVTAEEHVESLKPKMEELLKKTGNRMYQNFMEEAQNSQYRLYYSKLNHYLNERTYFLEEHSTELISIIFRLRGELLNLNFIPHRPELPILCTLCNRNEREDVFHFIAVCPVLREFRVHYFGVQSLDLEETIHILNGSRGWKVLYNFTVKTFKYRNCIVNEDF